MSDLAGTKDLKSAAGSRDANRHRVLKCGIIAYHSHGSTMPCAVRDFSTSGARLIMDAGMSPPDTFDLIIELDGIEATCAVKWRRGREVGVAFQSDLRARLHQRKQSLIATRPKQKPTLRHKPAFR